MSKFQVLSDLHCENYYPNIPDVSSLIVPNVDYLVLAGDICRLELYDYYKSILLLFSPHYKLIFLVPGNYEYYSQTKYIEELDFLLHRLQGDVHNLKILNDNFIDLPDNIRLYGTTLWSYIPRNAPEKYLPILSLDGPAGTKTWLNKEYYKSVYALENIITQSKNLGKKLYVITHHAPTFHNTLKPHHVNDQYRFYYVSDLDYLLNSNLVKVWIYGHTHFNVDFIHPMGTRVISNHVKTTKYEHKIIEELNNDCHY